MRPDEVQIPTCFRVFIERYFGDLGRSWLAEMPTLVSRYAGAWQLDVESPFEGLTFNYVAPVIRSDGTPAVLKIGVPEQEQRAEIFALRAFADRGIAQLLESNVEDRVSLIERLSPGEMLSTYFPERDDEATEAAAKLMNQLAIPAPAERHEFSTLEGWATRGMRGLREAFDGGAGPFPVRLVERAESLFDEFITSTGELSLIHGDLHHMNILSSDLHRGWLAIDPKGVIGDRAYEAAPFILNPNTSIHTTPNLKRLFARRIDQLSEALDVDRYRIHGWALAFSVLSAWWDYDDTGNWRRTIALGEQLAEL
ncbi:aminoglycoside phosphotransferase family protein [soil metagenome]